MRTAQDGEGRNGGQEHATEKKDEKPGFAEETRFLGL